MQWCVGAHRSLWSTDPVVERALIPLKPAVGKETEGALGEWGGENRDALRY